MTIFESPKLGLEFVTDPGPGWPGPDHLKLLQFKHEIKLVLNPS